MAYGVNAPFGLRPFCSINGGSWTEKVNEYYIYTSADGTTTYPNSIFTGDPVVWGTSVAATVADGITGTIAVYSPTYTDGTPSTFSTVPILGVFMGCEYLSVVNGVNNLIKSAYWPGGAQVVPGTVIKAFVLDDPNVVYDVQISTHCAATIGNTFSASPTFPNVNATAGLLLYGNFGSNFALNIGGGTGFTAIPNLGLGGGTPYANNPATGNTRTGQSGFYLDVNTGATTAVPPVAALTHDYSKQVNTLPLRALKYTPNPNNIAAPGLTMATTPFINVLVTINNPAYAIGSAPTVIVA
jgi:hypothetical protein